MTRAQVMIVEDEAITAMALEVSLAKLGYEVVATVSSGEEAITTARQRHLDVVLMDIQLRGVVDGVGAAQIIRQETDVPCVYLTAFSDEATLKRAKIAEPYGYLVKPYAETELRACIEIAIHNGAMERDRRLASEALLTREKLLQDIIDNSPAIIYLKDDDDRYTLVNRSFERILGVGRADARAKTSEDVLSPAIREGLGTTDREVLADGEARQEERDLPLSEGTRRYVVIRFALRRPDGSVYGVCGVLTDVTELRRTEEEIRRLNLDLEERVDARTKELERANGDLEAFTRSVSHDLRAPVRGIGHLVEELQARYASDLDADGNRLIAQVRKESQRLALLLAELLGFSRARSSEMTLRDVDLTSNALDVVGRLRREAPARDVRVDVEPDLHAHGDEMLLHLALDNLIANAWKFTSKTPDAHIEVGQMPGSDAVDGKPTFFVRDNGVGFPPDKAGRLFQPFQRLHDPGDFAGTGLGLSSVRSIVERHGGRVWATGEPGHGATFCFTL